MSAVLTHIWSIDPTLDLTTLDAESVDEIWRQGMSPSLLESWNEQLKALISEGDTASDSWNITLNVSTRTLRKQRQFTDITGAEQRKQLLDNEMPTTRGPFSRISVTLSDDTTLDDLNLEQGYETQRYTSSPMV